MTDLADMIERVAEREELDRLRVENARLKRKIAGLERSVESGLARRYHEQQMNAPWPLYSHEQMRPMTEEELAVYNARQQSRPMQWYWHEEAKPAPLSWLFGGITGARWP